MQCYTTFEPLLYIAFLFAGAKSDAGFAKSKQ